MRPPRRVFAVASALLVSAVLNTAPVVADSGEAAQQPDRAMFNLVELDTDNYTPSIPSPPPQRNEATPRNQQSADENRQRAQERQQRLENQMRQAMSNLGCSDISTQDAIISYIGTDMRARRGLQGQSRRLLMALRSKDMSEDEIARMVSDFRSAVEADKQRRTASEAALDGRIKYSQNARLEAMLLLFGVIGESPLLSVMREASVPAPDNRNTSPREKNATPPRRPSAYDNPMQNSPAPDATAPGTTPQSAQQNDSNAAAGQAQSEAQDKKEKPRKNREDRDNKKERSTSERSAEESQE